MVRLYIVVLLALSIGGCSSDSSVNAGGDSPDLDPETGQPVVLDLAVSDTLLDALGASTIWNVSARDGNGSSVAAGPYTWSLSAEGVIGLNTSGQGDSRASIWSVANGRVTVTVMDASVGLSASTDIIVDQRLARLVDPTGRLLMEFPGDTLTIPLSPADRLGNQMEDVPVEWESADPGIVTVDDTGLLTAASLGTGRVMVRTSDFEEAVSIDVAGDRYFLSGNTALRYDLDLPSGPGPFPAVVWVHGSGEMTRNTQRGATDPLVPEGVAVLRYDKRGVGESGGVYFGIGPGNAVNGLGQLAADASAAIDFLSHFPDIDMGRVGLAANSQGGWISPLAASMNPEIDFMLIWSGPTVSVGLEIFYSNLTAAGGSLDEAYGRLSTFSGSPGYDPMPTLESLDIPSLWLFGAEDRSIPVRLDVDNLERLRSDGLPYEYIVYPNAGHDLRDLTTGQFNDVWNDWLSWMRGHQVL